MSENLDLLKQGYKDYARGDIEAATGPWAQDIRWEGAASSDLPGSGVHEGKQAVIENALAVIPAHYDEFRVEPDEFVEQGDTIVVLGHNHSRAKATGRSKKLPFVHVWRFEDGQPKRVQLLTDTLEVAEELGVR